MVTFEQAIDGLETRFRSTALTVSVLPCVAMKWRVPRLGAFQAAYPEIDVRLSSDVELPSFRREDVDIAIYYGYGDYPGLVAEQLASNFAAASSMPSLGSQTRESISSGAAARRASMSLPPCCAAIRATRPAERSTRAAR